MFTLNFWKQALERAVKTALQSVVATFAVGEGFNVFAVDWQVAGTLAASGFVLSIVTSFLTAGVGEGDSPSAVAIASAPPEPPREAGDANLGTIVTILVIVILVILILRLT